MLRYIHCNTVKLLEPLYPKFDLKDRQLYIIVMATVKEKAKIKIQCVNCEKTKVSWWFEPDADECKMCQNNYTTYVCARCDEETPYHMMVINRGNVQTHCKKCDTKTSKTRYDNNKVQRRQVVKAYTQKNWKKVAEYQKWYHSQPHQRIRNSLHGRIVIALKHKNAKKVMNTMPYLGCSLEFFLDWMEFQFEDDMSFDNYGQWHMDHCKPCNAFDLTDVDEQMKCFHWTNIQPMWGPDNLAKSDNYSEDELIYQQEKVAAFKTNYASSNNMAMSELLTCSIGEQEVEAFYYHPDLEIESAEPQRNLVKETEYQCVSTPTENLIIMTEFGKEPITLIDDL